MNKELIRGSVETVILRLLGEHPMYGYEMIKTVNERTDGFFEWKEGSLYPCLHTAGVGRAPCLRVAGMRRETPENTIR